VIPESPVFNLDRLGGPYFFLALHLKYYIKFRTIYGFAKMPVFRAFHLKRLILFTWAAFLC